MHKTHGVNVINLDTDTCPIKEDRVGSVNAYAGKISQLVKEGKKEGHFVQLRRKFQQTAMCMMTQTTGRIISVREAALVIHGAIGCGAAGIAGYRQIFKNIPPELGKPPDFELCGISTNLNERDIVYGGVEKLKKTIIEAERRYGPKAIFVITSCASGVMGDDIEGAVEAVKDKVKATIVPIHCEAFKTGISQTAFDSMAHAVVKYLVKEPRSKQEDLVAVPAPFSITWSDRLEIERLLGKMGLRALLIPDFATVTELERLSEVALVAPTCPSYGDYWQLALHEKFDIPYFRHPAPLGIKNTETWLRTIGEFTGKEKEAEKLIEEELTVVTPEIEKLKKEFKGKNGRIIVSAGLARAVFIPRFAADLGMEVSAVNTLELDPYIIDELKNVYEDIGDFEIHASNIQSFEQSHMLKRLNPELYTGCPFMGLYKREASNVRNHSFRHDFSPPALQIGFRGLLTYGYVMQRAFNNPSLCKTLHRTQPKPYKAWWYQQPDILYYTKENAVYGGDTQETQTVIPPEAEISTVIPEAYVPESPIADPGGLVTNGHRTH
jgi:nitrogenase molybdenum-iron protein alpha chain